MKKSDLSLLRKLLEQMRSAGRRRRMAAWERAHGAFHSQLVAGCEGTLHHQIRVMMDRSYRYRHMSVLGEQPHSWEIGEREHEAIVRACEARDPREGQQLLARHLSRSAFSVQAHLAPDSELAAVRAALDMVVVGADPPADGD
jgi:DNA-binding GntR family transcriptional regulator